MISNTAASSLLMFKGISFLVLKYYLNVTNSIDLPRYLFATNKAMRAPAILEAKSRGRLISLLRYVLTVVALLFDYS